MRWSLKWGSSLKAFKERAKKTGVKPAPLLARPKLQPADRPYLEAFYSLNASRSGGMSGPNPISIAEILALLTLQGIASSEARAKYLRLIQLLDSEFIEHCRLKSEQEAQRRKTTSGR